MRAKVFDSMVKLGFTRVSLRPNGVICEMDTGQAVQLVQVIIIKDQCAIITYPLNEWTLVPDHNDYEDIVWRICPVSKVSREVQNIIWIPE